MQNHATKSRNSRKFKASTREGASTAATAMRGGDAIRPPPAISAQEGGNEGLGFPRIS